MVEESLTFDSDTLNLEARLAYKECLQAPTGKVLLCPPHPFLGGDMDNNVLSQLKETLAAAGLIVFRFNYRGIGASQCARDLREDQQQFWENSSCPEYEAEIHVDCLNAFREIRRVVPNDMPLYVIGYSFGCLPAIVLSRDGAVDKLILVSPPLKKWPISEPHPRRPIATGLFYAPGDFACPEADIRVFFAGLAEPKSLHAFNEADHFFIGHEPALAGAIRTFLLNT